MVNMKRTGAAPVVILLLLAVVVATSAVLHQLLAQTRETVELFQLGHVDEGHQGRLFGL